MIWPLGQPAGTLRDRASTEVIVDPREAIAKLPKLLLTVYEVEFHFGAVVTKIAFPKLTARGETWTAKQILVCSGADFETLHPDLYVQSGITKVKL